MSLINDMLKDLEKRPRAVMASENLLVGLSTSISSEFRRHQRYYFIIGSLIIFLIGIIVSISTRHTHTTVPTVKAGHSPIVATAPNPAIEESAKLAAKAREAQLTGIALQLQQNMTFLRFLLNKNTLYRVSSDVIHNQLIIILEHTRLVAALPKINYAGSGIESVQAFSDENDNLKLVLSLNPAVDVRRLEITEDGKSPELQLDLYYQNDVRVPAETTTSTQAVNPPATIPVIIKKPAIESQVEEQYELASNLISAGNALEAKQVLKKSLIADPTFLKGRALLASLLIQENNQAEATKVIEAGLTQRSNDYTLLELKARLLVNENKSSQALALLEGGGPAIRDNPEYHAFVAALYQRQGKPDLAATIYKQLLALQPENSKWWLGLGVALESSGNPSQANEAYSRADSIGNLNPELAAYVESRIHSG